MRPNKPDFIRKASNMQVLIGSTSKNDHITQAVVKGDTTGYWFDIYQVYAPGGRHHRRCSLETGKVTPSLATARSQARAAFERQTGVRLKTPNRFVAAYRYLVGKALAPFRALAHRMAKVKFSR
ncbi:MAG: hypothetical protein K2W95_14845 [Candidatus Obscuribacterales bacterium]|nr:hypothetical protein [Candidatus Obscuribacterales bacterium]